MARSSEWVLLAYRLPREPSTPRITLWRKLRRLGVLQVVDGLVALPATAETDEAFGWLADEVVEAGGEAWTWRATPGSKGQQAELTRRINDAVAEEYRGLAEEAASLGPSATPRTLQRLRRELRRIESRDRFGAPGAGEARRAVEGAGVAVADAGVRP